jgi:hypothetical protein
MIAASILTFIFFFSDGSLFFGAYVVSRRSIFYAFTPKKTLHMFFVGTMDNYKKLLDEESKNL